VDTEVIEQNIMPVR